MIELEPLPQTGEAVLNFQFTASTNRKCAHGWSPSTRLDTGRVSAKHAGHKTLSGNIQELRDVDADNQLSITTNWRSTQGHHPGDYLLTIAYGHRQGNRQSGAQAGDRPHAYYTLYADATQASFDAASSSRLYRKTGARSSSTQCSATTIPG